MKISIKELLWPNRCPFCEKAEKEGACLSCREKLEALVIQEPRCMKCGKPIRYEEREYCHDCSHADHAYDRGAALWLHREPVSASIYRFKYHNQRYYAAYYAACLAEAFKAPLRRWDPEMIVPVPLHPRRRRKRGYNQAEILAKELGKLLHVPVNAKAVLRVRDTKPQKILNDRLRRKNMKGAFATGKSLEGAKRVLVIDDIYTTGNTVSAVAETLKKAGVQKVYFLTISIGQGY